MKTSILLVLLLLPAFAETVQDCANLQAECVEQCNEICGQERYDYCREAEYSGCALDILCWCNVCGIYDSKWCPRAGFLGCAGGARDGYRSCIEGCNSKMRAGQDVSTCWGDCNAEFEEKITGCKDGVCPEFCEEEGFTTGKWARYTQDFGWDSCLCEGEVEEDFEDVAFPTAEDSDADGIPDWKDWCPYDEGPSVANGCPDGDRDGVPDDADKCPGERGTWEYAGCEKTALDSFAEAPYQAKNFLYWLFTKEEERGVKRMGFISAIKNKEGVRIYRPGKKKWYRVGVQTPLYEGDRIRTLSDSRVKVALFEHDGTQDIVEVRSNTLFETPGPINTYEGERRIVHVLKGIVKTAVRRFSGDKPDFYVKTPTVCLGVRGTEFIVGHDPETGRDTVMVLEGRVEVDGSESLNLTGGQQVEALDGELARVQALDQARWDELAEEEWDEVAGPSLLGSPIALLAAAGLLAALYFLKFRK